MYLVDRRLTLSLAISVLCLASPAASQEVRPLGDPTGRAAEGFTSIFDVAELPDGRVLITDNRETSLAVIDFDGTTVRRIGRRGQGPLEFQTVFSILPGTEKYRIYDTRNARFLRISAQGEILGTESFVRPPFLGLAPPRGPDADGGVYFHLRTVGPNGLDQLAVIYRWDPATGQADSVGVVAQYASGQEGPGIVPMPQGDAWSVLPDGSVLRLVGRDYHAEWAGGVGGDAMGDPISFPRLEVDGAQRDRWIAGMLTKSGGSRFTSSSSDPGARERRIRRYRSELDPRRFPDFLPPFIGGYKPAAPWGEVWLRLEPASDQVRTVFDVIGRRGELVRRVSVDGLAQVVGFGPASVYLVRVDEFDLQWLERYDRPR
jgi:hypothetical protein